MEYDGIVAGIGDLENQVNLVSPEMDAALYKYVMNKNTIISGLEVNSSGTLSPGMCILCGYRGVLETAITLDNNLYVYAKFVLNFNNSIIDTFSIETSNEYYSPPTSITTAGTYRLLLYIHPEGSSSWNANDDLDLSNKFPNYAKHSEQTELVKAGGILRDGVTGFTHNVNDNSNHIATTQYVHNQIAEEVDYQTTNGSLSYGAYTGRKKAKYVILYIDFGSGAIQVQDGATTTEVGTLPEGWRPNSNYIVECGVQQQHILTACFIQKARIFPTGEVVIYHEAASGSVGPYYIYPTSLLVGFDSNI